MYAFKIPEFINPNIALLCALGVMVATLLIGNLSALMLAVPFVLVGAALLYKTLGSTVKRYNPQQKICLSLFVLAAAIVYYKMALTAPSFVADNDSVVRWGYLDKRPAIIGLMLVYVGICFVKFLNIFDLNSTQSSLEPALPDQVFPRGTAARLGFGVLGACLFYIVGVGLINPNILLDSHLEGLVGGMKQMHDGAVPYIEAKTQYGPGTQILLHELMDIYGHTYEGAFRTHQFLNLVSLTGFGFLLFWFAGPVIGILSLICLFLLPGPFYAFNFAGWGVYLRWLGGLTITILMAEIFFSNRLIRSRYLKWIAICGLGLLTGLFCFMGQEALTSSIIATVCILGLAAGFKNISLVNAILSGLLIIISAVIAFLGLEAVWIGTAHLPEMLSDYFRGPQLVSQGVSNSHWIWPTSFHFVFFFIGIIGHIIALLMLTTLDMSGPLSRHRLKIFAGLIIASLILNATTLLRIDTAHMDGPAFLIYTLFLVIIAMLLHGDNTHKDSHVLGVFTIIAFGVSLVLVPMSIPYVTMRAVPSAENFWHASQWRNAMQAVGLKARPERENRRFETNFENFFVNDPADDTVKFTSRTGKAVPYEETLFLAKKVNEIVDGRTAVVTSDIWIKDRRTVPGGIYFLANIKPATPITEPMLSIWLESERKAWIADINASDAACLISGDWQTDLYVASWRQLEGLAGLTESDIDIDGETAAKVYCR